MRLSLSRIQVTKEVKIYTGSKIKNRQASQIKKFKYTSQA